MERVQSKGLFTAVVGLSIRIVLESGKKDFIPITEARMRIKRNILSEVTLLCGVFSTFIRYITSLIVF